MDPLIPPAGKTLKSNRETLYTYWNQFSGDPSIETMMLNPHAKTVDESDKMDVLEGLPSNTANMSVLEIGAGIGRFTEPLAKQCRTVHATDFIQSFVDRNRELHAEKYPNVTFSVGDCVHMQEAPSSHDLVFTNWLLMYLTDTEVAEFLLNSLKWLRPGGYMTLRESCTESSTRSKSTNKVENPTHYRHISQYIRLFQSIRWQDPDTGRYWTLKPLWSRSIRTYVFVKNNWRQCQMLVRKVPVADSTPQHTKVSTPDSLCAELDEAFRVQAAVDEEIRQWHAKKQAEPEPEKLETLKKEVQMLSNGQEDAQLTVLNLTPRDIDCFSLAEACHCSVLGLCSDPFKFSGWLDVAVTTSDRRVSFAWTEFDAENWILAESADVICGLESLETFPNFPTVLECLKKSLKPNGKLLFLSPISSTLFSQLQTQFSLMTISCPKETTLSTPVQAEPITPLDSASSDEEENEKDGKLKNKTKKSHLMAAEIKK